MKFEMGVIFLKTFLVTEHFDEKQDMKSKEFYC